MNSRKAQPFDFEVAFVFDWALDLGVRRRTLGAGSGEAVRGSQVEQYERSYCMKRNVP